MEDGSFFSLGSEKQAGGLHLGTTDANNLTKSKISQARSIWQSRSFTFPKAHLGRHCSKAEMRH